MVDNRFQCGWILGKVRYEICFVECDVCERASEGRMINDCNANDFVLLRFVTLLGPAKTEAP